jgi:polyphosphate kinase
MTRNLDYRVEVLFPVEDEGLIQHLRNEVLPTYLADNVKARWLMADGTYAQPLPVAGEGRIASQATFLQRASQAPRG